MSITVATARVLSAVPADKEPGCAADGGTTICRFVWERTQVAWLAETSQWLVTTPLRITMIILLALIARWLLHRAIARVTRSTAEGVVPTALRPLKERMPAALEAAGLLSERRRQRAETIGSLLRSTASVAVLGVTVMLILGEFHIALGPLLASAGIVGVALGFGAQTLVKDILAGVFMMLEDQCGVGDLVDLGPARGTVEAVGLRTTTVRDAQGVLWYVRNGEVLRVGNRSQGWAVVMVDVPIGFDTTVEEATEVLEPAAASLAEDPDWSDDLLDPPTVLGVEEFGADGPVLRVTVKTTPDAQWRIGRELRRRLAEALSAAGIAARLSVGRLFGRPTSGNGGNGDDAGGPT